MLKDILIKGLVIHTTRNNKQFTIHSIIKNRVYFLIPNNKNPKLPYKKSIPIELIEKIEQEVNNYDFKFFPFKDCRKSAAKGIIRKINEFYV